ncbi:hypothetical protein [Oceanobacillus luteolus]|uniref:DUF4083 domain-containing protein n=1 Tax=Oceanobacillus luteolus TaxID=1274358 RepID=A0ABW4HQ80_9BACI
MEFLIMFIVTIIVVFLAAFSIIGGVSQRIKKPNSELNERITELESKVKELEKK